MERIGPLLLTIKNFVVENIAIVLVFVFFLSAASLLSFLSRKK